MPRLTIQKVTAGEKVGTVTFAEKPNAPVKFWMNDPFAQKLIAGAQAQARIERTPERPKQGGGVWPAEDRLVMWDGLESVPQKKGGGGGGFRQTPEQVATEKASILASVALKEAISYHANDELRAAASEVTDTANTFLSWLVDAVKRSKGALL